jgi:hypothetical protein
VEVSDALAPNVTLLREGGGNEKTDKEKGLARGELGVGTMRLVSDKQFYT